MIEIQFQYRPFVELKVEHDYYVKNLSKDLHFIPTTQSENLARSMGLLIKSTGGGISISYDVINEDALLHYLMNNEDIEFTFLLTTNNHSFVNFTNMATESVGKIFSYNTLNAKKQKDNEFRLHEKEFVTKEDCVVLKRGDFYYVPKSDNATIELKNADGDTILEKTLEGKPKYMVQMSRMVQGSYSIYENGKSAMDFAYVTQPIQKHAAIAMITVSLSGADKKDLISTLEKGEVLPAKQYKLHFESRSTYWKYYVVSKYKLPLDKSSIHSEGDDVKFSGPEKVKLSNGDTAFLFEANMPLPLNEVPKYNFKLSKSKKPGGGEAYLNRLPTPSPDSVKPESRDESAKVYSELFVYI